MKKTYLANLMTGNVLLHNLHWNVEGRAFKQVHEYLELLYDDAFSKYDEVAERMKMDGELPSATLKEYLDQTNISELEEKRNSKDQRFIVIFMIYFSLFYCFLVCSSKANPNNFQANE